ncbi:MAG: TVP38/TMEM64 family protein [Verrucomicrobia bacterium]|nr:TVP38/TMEM64 family protein [Verrucomicrobiota bacterium]
MNESNDNALLAAAEAGPEDEAQGKRRAIKKAAVLVAVLAALVALTSLPPVRHFISENMPRLKQFIQDCGPWAPAVFIAAVAAMTGVGIPRLAFHFLGGALFAFWGGLVWSCIGTMIGYACVFFAVRQLGLRELILRKHPLWQKLAAKLRHNTIPAVILFRQMPMPGLVTNTVLGLSPIRRREFFLGTSIGLVPEAVPLTLLGAGLRKEELGHTVIYLFAAVVLFIAVWIGWGIYTRRAAAKEAALDQ